MSPNLIASPAVLWAQVIHFMSAQGFDEPQAISTERFDRALSPLDMAAA